MTAPLFGKGATAVRASKRPRLPDGLPGQQLELFATPPWATRALLRHVLPQLLIRTPLGMVWEPCCGLGHMAEVLGEAADRVWASDIRFYAGGKFGLAAAALVDACDPAQVARFAAGRVDWIITNPPFSAAETMLPQFLAAARLGVALLLRLQWIETLGRYERVFRPMPPTLVAPFAERVPMCEGGWDPGQHSQATAYAWFVWLKTSGGGLAGARPGSIRLDTFLIPPGCRKALSLPDDLRMAAWRAPGFAPPPARDTAR